MERPQTTEVRQTDGSHEDTRLTDIACEILREAPSILRTRDHVHSLSNYVISSACPRDNFHRLGWIKTVTLKRYGLSKSLMKFA